MQKIIVINAKGGCGKTTITTNLASFYAVHGYKTALFDYDPQSSSTQWLTRRSDSLAEIRGISATKTSASATRSWIMRLSPDTDRVIIDTPAGVKAHELSQYLKGVTTIVIPVLPSIVDVEASAAFVQNLIKIGKVQGAKTQVVVVANRVKNRSPALKVMQNIFEDVGVPVVARLRDSASYVQGTDLGKGIHELPAQVAKGERRAWENMIKAIDPEFEADLAAGKVKKPRHVHSGTDSSVLDISLSISSDLSERYRVSWK